MIFGRGFEVCRPHGVALDGGGVCEGDGGGPGQELQPPRLQVPLCSVGGVHRAAGGHWLETSGHIVQLLGPPVVQTQVVVAVCPAEWTVGTTGLGQVSPAATQGTDPMSLTCNL